jgi:hypothetical protein
MNFLVDGPDKTQFKSFIDQAIIPQAHHLRSLYIQANYSDLALSFDMQDCTIALLQSCSNLTSLGLYFQDTMNDIGIARLGRAVVSLIERGNLSNLGLYDKHIITEDADFSEFIPMGGIITAISESELARTRLKALEISACPMTMEAYDEIRSKFPNLNSFSVRSGLIRDHGRIWEPAERQKWEVCQNLTKLQFFCCENVYAPHVPHLVRALPKLRELLVSTCGNPTDIIINSPLPADWHKQPDALCNVRPPLDWFHIEHMDDWEIRSMATIPTKVLIITTVKSTHFLKELKADNQIFPGMRQLRLSALSPSYAEELETGAREKSKGMITLEELCAAREIKITRDAKQRYICSCRGTEGF